MDPVKYSKSIFWGPRPNQGPGCIGSFGSNSEGHSPEPPLCLPLQFRRNSPFSSRLLNGLIAVLTMFASSLTVIGNALRITKKGKNMNPIFSYLEQSIFTNEIKKFRL